MKKSHAFRRITHFARTAFLVRTAFLAARLTWGVVALSTVTPRTRPGHLWRVRLRAWSGQRRATIPPQTLQAAGHVCVRPPVVHESYALHPVPPDVGALKCGPVRAEGSSAPRRWVPRRGVPRRWVGLRWLTHAGDARRLRARSPGHRSCRDRHRPHPKGSRMRCPSRASPRRAGPPDAPPPPSR